MQGAITKLLIQLAFRNVMLYRFRTTITALLLGFGTCLAVLGLSILDDMEGTMRESITGSVVGEIQVYSNKAKDDLSLFGGGGFMGKMDSGTIDDIRPVAEVAMKHPNVKAFMPLGVDMVFLGRGNELDDTIDELRKSLKAKDFQTTADRVDQLNFQLERLHTEIGLKKQLASDQKEIEEELQYLAKVSEPAFQDSLKANDEMSLQFLETKIAPLSGEKSPVYLNIVGTDIRIFRDHFPKLTVVEGNFFPPGQRGIMLSRKFREEFLKNLVARIFDKLHKRLIIAGMTIKDDAENKRLAADLPRQFTQIIAHLDRREATALYEKLTPFLSKPETLQGDISQKMINALKEFLRVHDGNFLERFTFFYKEIAPLIKLYEISPGETIVLRSYTKSGYIKNLPLPVYGVYAFQGLEDSDIAGALNVIDLLSFRELYGQMSGDALDELAAMRSAIGIKEIASDQIEDQLFGNPESTVEVRQIDAPQRVSQEVLQIEKKLTNEFREEEIQKGMAISAAIRLKNPQLLRETMADLEDMFKKQQLDLRVIDWQTASGIAGQFVVIVRIALVFSLCIIFLVALVIINNSIVASTLNRVREIGTMRALGASQGFVKTLFLWETGLTGALGSICGGAISSVLIWILHYKGIPATNDVVSFLFSGPRLYPSLTFSYALIMPFIITAMATLTSLFAARHGARISPAVSMQEKELSMLTMILMALRNLILAKKRTFLLGVAISIVASLFLVLQTVSKSIATRMIESATTLSAGHINVGGFFKLRARGQDPILSERTRLRKEIKELVPEASLIIDRHRGWGRLISPSSSFNVGMSGLVLEEEGRFFKSLRLAKELEYKKEGRDVVLGNFDDLKDNDTVLIFAAQAKKLEVGVGDIVTVVTEASGGQSNTKDLKVVAIASDIGFMSNWNIFMRRDIILDLYKAGEETTGVIMVYLQDPDTARTIMERLRGDLEKKGHALLDYEPNPFFFKFDKVAGEDFLGQRLDLTIWSDEISFVMWITGALDLVSVMIASILLMIIIGGLINAISMSVRERTKEIGTMRAIGAKKSYILSLFLWESLLLGAIAAAVGIGMGALGLSVVNALALPITSDGPRLFLMANTIQFPLDTGVMMKTFFMFSLVTGICSLWPAYRASRLRPVEALMARK